jgi:hypothetical protein
MAALHPGNAQIAGVERRLAALCLRAGWFGWAGLAGESVT